ncbi:MAG: hypothetical protein FJ278_13080 [Planctomycetes bacterium]|nr:hypothetical protein [Planctomycetota bacterium]
MGNKVTLAQVEELATKLPRRQQLRLVARVSEQLSASAAMERRRKKAVQKRVAEVKEWLAECDAVAESIEGKFDSAADIRQIREDRTNRL